MLVKERGIKMELYLGNIITSISSLSIISIWIYIGYTYIKRNTIKTWGRRVLCIALWGLGVCILAATRDGYHYSVQAAIGESIEVGLFTLPSIQSRLCTLAGAVIGFATLSSLFIRKQGYWKVMFFILSSTIIFKTLLIEASRIVML